jgi:hypothetical protein
VLSFLGDDDRPAPSSLEPERVAEVLTPVWG